jgi:hypothetical protein
MFFILYCINLAKESVVGMFILEYYFNTALIIGNRKYGSLYIPY